LGLTEAPWAVFQPPAHSKRRLSRRLSLGPMRLLIIRCESFLALAAKYGADLVRHRKTFQTMRAGYACDNFVFRCSVGKITEPVE